MSDVTPSVASPFDALKHVDDQGEYWLGRNLVEPLGYLRWERFEDAIERGRAALAANGQDPDMHVSGFAAPGNGVGAAQTRSDYRMTREGVYATIQGADPRKPAIAAAWSYFRAKTREAEVARPVSNLDILAGAIRALQEQEAAVAALTAGQAEIVQRQVELEARQDLLQENHERVSSVGWANLRKARSDVWFLAKLGRKAAKIAKRDDIEPSRVHSQIFGEVHSWPLHIWDEAYEAIGGA